MLGALTMSRLFAKMREVTASDLHIKVGSPPVMRVSAVLHRIETPALNVDDTRQLLMAIVPKHLEEQLLSRGGIDFSHHEPNGERFRCSVFSASGGLHAAIRRVNPTIPSFKDLRLPPIYEKVARTVHEGLVVICGVTGSGKSSTLAAIIDHINATQPTNIITLEDPIEYLFTPREGVISQREIGLDVPDFATGLRSAVRQDPDVIMIGEMRDRETMLAGLMAAETGHLVFVTLHTADTMQSFSRILEFFPSHEHNFIRSSMAVGLKAVMAQRLLPASGDAGGVVPATEVLLNSPIVADRIREGEDEDIPAIIAGSHSEGMHSFTDSLVRLVEEESVDLKVAEQYAPNRDVLISRVRGVEVAADKLVTRVKSARS